MKVTALTAGKRDPGRINISIDGAFVCSLTLAQVVDAKIRVGTEITEEALQDIEQQSQLGKLYQRALEYTLMRPHSAWEIRQYLQRKTREQQYKKRNGEFATRPGVSQNTIDHVYERLEHAGYIDDSRFAEQWIETRHQTKGASRRKLQLELRQKGVDGTIIEDVLSQSERSDSNELQKVIEKKRARYTDKQKFMAYLMRQGFSYGDITTALQEEYK